MTVDRKTLLQTGLAMQATRERTVPRSWIAQVMSDSNRGRRAALGARPISIGAGRDCDLILDDEKVSRRHAEVRATPEGIHIVDPGSTNGTFWQGSRITEAVVPIGASVTFGETVVRFTSAEVPSVPPSDRSRFGGLVGHSIVMRELFAVLDLAAPTDATVVIEGESGTGKELAARAIHDHSARAAVPLVVVDCGAVTETLLDSHLFGHIQGAFTGAISDRKGAFVDASGGTLFLDELGELSLPSQARLLRVLEDQTVQPVGSDKRVKVDTRVVAATNRDLSRMVDEGTFRFDLFYRLAVVHARIPPLRERIEELAQLIAHFYEGRGEDPGPIDGPNLERMQGYAWPGNVRELRNALERAWALSGPGASAFRDLRIFLGAREHAPPAEVIDTSLPFKNAKERWVDSFERRYLATVFAQHNGNITHAAQHAGINRRHFRELLRKHGIYEA